MRHIVSVLSGMLAVSLLASAAWTADKAPSVTAPGTQKMAKSGFKTVFDSILMSHKGAKARSTACYGLILVRSLCLGVLVASVMNRVLK